MMNKDHLANRHLNFCWTAGHSILNMIIFS